MPFWVKFKEHYCPACGEKLITAKVSKIVNSKSEEAKNFDFYSGDNYMIGNIKFIYTEFRCTSCGKSYRIKEIKANEKALTVHLWVLFPFPILNATNHSFTLYIMYAIILLKGGAFMNTEVKKSTQIFHGILTGIGLWVFGHLLSGKLSFVEDIDLYNTGFLVFLFPYIFALSCILVTKYSVKSEKPIYFKTSLICFLLPVFCAAISFLLGFIMELKIPVISFIADITQIIFILPVVPALSVFSKMLELFGTETDGLKLVLLIALNLLPIIIGLIFSIKIYCDNCDR